MLKEVGGLYDSIHYGFVFNEEERKTTLEVNEMAVRSQETGINSIRDSPSPRSPLIILDVILYHYVHSEIES